MNEWMNEEEDEGMSEGMTEWGNEVIGGVNEWLFWFYKMNNQLCSW